MYSLRDTLDQIIQSREAIEYLMFTTPPDEVQTIFYGNPVFYEGITDPDENEEVKKTDQYIHFMDLLSKTHTSLLQAQERMMRLGAHHTRSQQDAKKEGQVRQSPRKVLPPRMDEDDESTLSSSTSISPD